jgi:type IV secretory pathway TraG/TraD family ATPase VirD4
MILINRIVVVPFVLVQRLLNREVLLMKFRAEPKDILIFILFAILLLYLVAIGILNFVAFAETGVSYGFNPFPAFRGDYLYPTIVFYLIILIVIMFSVGSYFFDREKGFGLITNKSDKGYSRWAKPAEVKKFLKRIIASDNNFNYGGVPIISDGEEIWVDDGEPHSLIIGTTGSGKTRRFAHPLIQILAKKGESLIATDPKAELYQHNAGLLLEKGYKIVIINLRDPQEGNAWNPLNLPYQLYKSGNQDKANELLDDLAVNILYEENPGNADPFWEKTSADYFSGLALALFEDAKEEEINLNSINLMSTVGEEPFGGSTYIKEYFATKDPAKPSYTSVASALFAPSETKGSILSVFKQKIRLFSARERLSEMLSYSDFNMYDIGREKTAVFIIIQDEKKTYHPLATIFVKQCYEALIDVAQQNGGKLPVRTNFVLDEFANMPPLKDITTMITAARSRLIRFNLIIQNFAQLNQVYGKENAETIKGNCANLIYLLSSELTALKEISELCGEVKSKDKDNKGQTKPLITVSELQTLKMGEVIINKHRLHPFKTKFPDLSAYSFSKKKYEKGRFPVRDMRKIELFDLKEFVKTKKRDKLFEMLDSGNTPPPIPPRRMDFNVDELVKKIDAKIAALEEEEQKEQAQKKTSPLSSVDDTKKKETKKQQAFKPGVSDTKETKKPLIYFDEDDTPEDDEDHFFDDFFDDE